MLRGILLEVMRCQHQNRPIPEWYFQSKRVRQQAGPLEHWRWSLREVDRSPKRFLRFRTNSLDHSSALLQTLKKPTHRLPDCQWQQKLLVDSLAKRVSPFSPFLIPEPFRALLSPSRALPEPFPNVDLISSQFPLLCACVNTDTFVQLGVQIYKAVSIIGIPVHWNTLC